MNTTSTIIPDSVNLTHPPQLTLHFRHRRALGRIQSPAHSGYFPKFITHPYRLGLPKYAVVALVNYLHQASNVRVGAR
jgi:hypothetical protein